MKRDLARRIGALPWRAKLTLLWRMLRDPAVPLGAKAVLPALAGYIAFPGDLIPDFIPVLGQLDDLAVLALGLGLFVLLTPRPILESHLLALE